MGFVYGDIVGSSSRVYRTSPKIRRLNPTENFHLVRGLTTLCMNGYTTESAISLTMEWSKLDKNYVNPELRNLCSDPSQFWQKWRLLNVDLMPTMSGLLRVIGMLAAPESVLIEDVKITHPNAIAVDAALVFHRLMRNVPTNGGAHQHNDLLQKGLAGASISITRATADWVGTGLYAAGLGVKAATSGAGTAGLYQQLYKIPGDLSTILGIGFAAYGAIAGGSRLVGDAEFVRVVGTNSHINEMIFAVGSKFFPITNISGVLVYPIYGDRRLCVTPMGMVLVKFVINNGTVQRVYSDLKLGTIIDQYPLNPTT